MGRSPLFRLILEEDEHGEEQLISQHILMFLDKRDLRCLRGVAKKCRRDIVYLPMGDSFMRQVLECLRKQKDQNPIYCPHIGMIEIQSSTSKPNLMSVFLRKDPLLSHFHCLEFDASSIDRFYCFGASSIFTLDNILKIKIAGGEDEAPWDTRSCDLRNCLLRFPNLQELNISGMMAGGFGATISWQGVVSFPNLHQDLTIADMIAAMGGSNLFWQGVGEKLRILRLENSSADWDISSLINQRSSTLRELYVDGTEIPPWILGYPPLQGKRNRLSASVTLPVVHSPLEKISCVNTVTSSYLPRHLTDDDLTEIVRHSPNLKWFRSHLSATAIPALKEEFPEVTFVDPDNNEL